MRTDWNNIIRECKTRCYKAITEGMNKLIVQGPIGYEYSKHLPKSPVYGERGTASVIFNDKDSEAYKSYSEYFAKKHDGANAFCEFHDWGQPNNHRELVLWTIAAETAAMYLNKVFGKNTVKVESYETDY